MKKTGRPSKPYRASWGENIDGLYRLPDGRWRITSTGQRYTEHDERLAIARFRRMSGQQTVTLTAPLSESLPSAHPSARRAASTEEMAQQAIGIHEGTRENAAMLHVDFRKPPADWTLTLGVSGVLQV